MAATERPRTSPRRAAILSAAAELFAARGFSGVGIDEIGARAGITGPAIYRHFAGKEALLAAVVERAIDAFTMAPAAHDPDVDELVAHAVRVALDDPTTLRTFVRERHRLQGEAKDDLARAERRLFRPWSLAIRAADPGLTSRTAALRQRAVLTALSEVASRPLGVERPVLDGLLVESIGAVLSVAPESRRAPAVRRTGWALRPSRRDEILAAALGLFRARGYHGVSIDEIGEAAGIAGPTIYFHYRSKADVLADAHERASIRVTVAVHDAVTDATSAADALDRLAVAHLKVARDNRDLILVTSRETAVLAEPDAARLTRRALEIVDIWVAVVQELRPELTPVAVRAVVSGAFPVVNQVAYALDPHDGARLVRAWVLGRPR